MEVEKYGLCFGTGKLLRALPFYLADQNKKRGEEVLPIKVVSISGRPEAAALIARLDAGKGYDIKIKGHKGGDDINREFHVNIVTGGFVVNPGNEDKKAELANVIADIKAGKVTYITSNTYTEFDKSYPEYLAILLYAAYEALRDGKIARPIPVFPLELAPSNGKKLKENILAEIAKHRESFPDYAAFEEYINRTHFANTSVDRIVTDDKDDATVAIAEPFAYIAIEQPADPDEPIVNPFGNCLQIEVVDNIIKAETRKLGILNAMHTAIVQKWIMEEGRQPSNKTVREFMDQHKAWVNDIRKELVAVVSKQFPDYDIEKFSLAVMDRFLNPFNNHRLSEIATDHAKKIDQRLNLVLDWRNTNAAEIETPLLDAMMKDTISLRQLEKAVGKENLAGLTIVNPQPHKNKQTRELPTTREDLPSALLSLCGTLNQRGVNPEVIAEIQAKCRRGLAA